MKICQDDNCTGCAACANVCPKHSIEMKENSFGELHPQIDVSTCVQCELCVKTCPVNNELRFSYPLKCYAAWNSDEEKRQKSATGGLGYLLARNVIEYENGIVFSTRYNPDLLPITTHTDNIVDLRAFVGSKYVQSYIDPDTFRIIKQSLLEGKNVVYIAMPCQVAGLLSFLHKKYSNLLTVDIICHGVCPTSYFIDEINYLKRKKNITEVSDVRFRGNDGYNYVLSLWNNNQLLYSQNCNENSYFYGFLNGITLRNNCFSCRYARPERVSDITIGDFIGLGNNVPFPYSVNNVSSVFVNTPKGLEYYESVLAHYPSLKNVTRSYEERLVYAPSLREPSKRHPLNLIFRDKVQTMGYVNAIQSLIKYKLLYNKLNRICHEIYYRFK